MNVLIFGRILAGVGGIGVYTGIMTILTTMTRENERPIYLGVVYVDSLSYFIHNFYGV
jgi:MFS family permease